MHFNGIIQLTRSQTKVVADALEPMVKELGGREKASLALGIKLGAIQKLLLRRASTEMRRDNFDVIIGKLGLDVSGWDLNRSL